MFTRLHILALLSIFFTSAVSYALPATTLLNEGLIGSCATHKLPGEEQFKAGYENFCATYLSPDRGPHIIRRDYPLVATFDLKAYDGNIVKWVYKITAATTERLPLEVPAVEATQASCNEHFKNILETNDAGGLDEAYCVVDKTGGDFFGGKLGKESMSGQGTVLVMGGIINQYGIGSKKFGRLIYESRKKAGA